MAKQPKRHIAVSPAERVKLEEAKRRYEEKRGPTDWGDFIVTVVGVGLAGLGIYAFARVLQHSEKSAELSCPYCESSFLLALPAGSQPQHPPVLEVDCPKCSCSLVVDLSKKGL